MHTHSHSHNLSHLGQFGKANLFQWWEKSYIDIGRTSSFCIIPQAILEKNSVCVKMKFLFWFSSTHSRDGLVTVKFQIKINDDESRSFTQYAIKKKRVTGSNRNWSIIKSIHIVYTHILTLHTYTVNRLVCHIHNTTTWLCLTQIHNHLAMCGGVRFVWEVFTEDTRWAVY